MSNEDGRERLGDIDRHLRWFVIGLLLCMLLLTCWAVQAEPFPEHLKESSQAFECYTFEMVDGVEHKKDKWIINWRMATEWFPNAKEPYILFQGRHLTRIPTPKDYNCVLWSPPKKKEED